MPDRALGMLSLDELSNRAAAGDIDTVVVGFTDHHGRLCGKRLRTGVGSSGRNP